MSYYCLLASAYAGHLNPMTVLGRELQRRGHRIVLVAPLDAQPKALEAGLEVQIVMALGRKGASAPGPLPGNPIVIDYAPQAALLRRASLVITHGGLNTTLESLSKGLPLVVVPIANDQPGIAARVTHLDVGEFTAVKRLTVAGMRQALRRVLTTPGYRESATRMAERLQRLTGQALAADLIEAAFTSRQRITHVHGQAQISDCGAMARGSH
jgi:MGT family glycosyltransferase